MFSRLLDEQPDLALVICRKLPHYVQCQLRASCRTLRSFLNASTCGVEVSAGFEGDLASALSAFPYADTLILRQSNVNTAAFCALLREHLHGSTAQRLTDLRLSGATCVKSRGAA